MAIRLHTRVMTPNGPGMIQGRLLRNGNEKAIVSHGKALVESMDENTRLHAIGQYYGGPWLLFAYELEDVEVIV